VQKSGLQTGHVVFCVDLACSLMDNFEEYLSIQPAGKQSSRGVVALLCARGRRDTWGRGRSTRGANVLSSSCIKGDIEEGEEKRKGPLRLGKSHGTHLGGTKSTEQIIIRSTRKAI